MIYKLDYLILRKNIVRLSIVLIITVTLIFMVMPVLAYSANDVSAGAVADLFRLFSISGVKDALGLNSPLYQAAHNFAVPLSETVTGIAAVWITGLTIFAILRETTHGSASEEMWLKLFIKFIIGVALVVWTLPILNGLDDIGNYILDEISDAASRQIISDGAITQSFTYDSPDTWNSSMMGTGAIGIVSIFLISYVKIISYALLIELALRRIFAPIAVSSIVLDGIRSPGMRFFKKYLAIYVKMAVIVASVAICGELCRIAAGVPVGTSTNIIYGSLDALECLALMCASISFIGKGATLADEVMGVNN